ncbi:MAG TPA: AAA family ATPase [Anaerolineaceae bacterium]|nr:AAA family ATPase [Anaerolineaceae bacterium]
MNDSTVSHPPSEEPRPAVRSLRELIVLVTGRNIPLELQEDSGLAEILPFPFLGLVGQPEMKLALILSVINPAIGGVLLIGPRGTGKTTAVRSLADILPEVQRSLCFYGCMEEDIQEGGMDAVCPDCARKYAEGQPLSRSDRVRLVELPLNSRLEDVIGGLDERAALQERLRLKRGILAQADLNILYVDEANLLADEIVDAILDGAAQGNYTVRRGPVSATYKSRFILIGSMNPEEGNLRPQIMDRFGLRILVKGIDEADRRYEAYQRVRAYQDNPRHMIARFAEQTQMALEEIRSARTMLPQVQIPAAVATKTIEIIQRMKIDSLRAEITLFETARAYAAADGRNLVQLSDIREVAPMALRLRRSDFITNYFIERQKEQQELISYLNELIPSSKP